MPATLFLPRLFLCFALYLMSSLCMPYFGPLFFVHCCVVKDQKQPQCSLAELR